MKKLRTFTRYFRCLDCQTEIPLQRMKNKRRSVGHIKDIYCIKCNTITKHEELPDEEDNNQSME